MANSAVGVIFSNIHDENIPELSRHRTMASIPYGGRYRLIDFALSNMVNAGITTVGVVTKYNYQSLLDHLGSGKDWDLARKDGGIILLPPYSDETDTPYSNRLEALKGITGFLNHRNEEYVVISDCDGIAHIDIADFDWTTKTVRLFGKGSKERIVPVYRRALDATRTYIDDARPLLVRASSDSAAIKRVDGPLFLSTRGNRMDANALRYRFHKLCREAGLPADITPHVMRHTFATDLLAGGADLRSVQELLGHASLSTTTLYTHLTPDRLKSAVMQAHPRADA